jgi:hypothetical protein
MLRWVVFGLALLAPASDGAVVYDFEWRVTASLSRLEGLETRKVSDELQGRGRLVLRRERDQVLLLEWSGNGGTGSGMVGPNGPEHLTFPLPPRVGLPPAPPHRGGGTFEFDGERERPTAFAITWMEAFYCRTAPKACGNITAWERSFAGIARRGSRDARALR